MGEIVVGIGSRGAGKKERPKRRLLDSIRNDLSERELSTEDTQDQAKWRRLARNTDPMQKWERMRKKKKAVTPAHFWTREHNWQSVAGVLFAVYNDIIK